MFRVPAVSLFPVTDNGAIYSHYIGGGTHSVHASGGPMMDIVTPFNESPTGASLLRSGSHRRFASELQ